MAKAGLLIKGSAIALVNGTYNDYEGTSTYDSWLSADKLVYIWYHPDTSYTRHPTVATDVYTPEQETEHRTYYVKNPITQEFGQINLQFDNIWLQLGNLDRVELTVEQLSVPEGSYVTYNPVSDEWKNVDFTEKSETTPVWEYIGNLGFNPDSENASRLYKAREVPIELYTATDTSRWTISRVTITDLGIQYGNELYYAFSSTDTTKPWNNLTWVYIGGGKGVIDTNLEIQRWDESSINVKTTTTTDPDGATRTTTVYTNLITGETHTDVNVVREKIKYEPQLLARYDYVNLTVGQVYRFRFVAEFSKLGWIPNDETQPLNAGVYLVDKVMSYYDMVLGRIDLYVNLYKKCNVPKGVFDDDKKRLADTVIYRLVDPTDNTKVIFMPQIFIEGQPDASVLKYDRMLLMVDLGIQPNHDIVEDLKAKGMNSHQAVLSANDLVDLADIISTVMAAKYGITASKERPLVQVSTYENVWLPDRSYQTVRDQREAVKAAHRNDFDQTFELAKSNRWYLDNQRLIARVRHQDELIQQLWSKQNN